MKQTSGPDNKKESKKESKKGRKNKQQPEMMMSELLSLISENEYPSYILEAANIVRNWMNDVINKNNKDYKDKSTDSLEDIFSEFFGTDFDDECGIDELYKRLSAVNDFADIMPTSKQNQENEGKSDTIIISIESSDYEGGLRSAIDYAAIFNTKCQRVWIISDSYVLGEILRFVPHIDALAKRGITFRFLLVTPWGWCELPLSGTFASGQNFLWNAG